MRERAFSRPRAADVTRTWGASPGTRVAPYSGDLRAGRSPEAKRTGARRIQPTTAARAVGGATSSLPPCRPTIGNVVPSGPVRDRQTRWPVRPRDQVDQPDPAAGVGERAPTAGRRGLRLEAAIVKPRSARIRPDDPGRTMAGLPDPFRPGHEQVAPEEPPAAAAGPPAAGGRQARPRAMDVLPQHLLPARRQRRGLQRRQRAGAAVAAELPPGSGPRVRIPAIKRQAA